MPLAGKQAVVKELTVPRAKALLNRTLIPASVFSVMLQITSIRIHPIGWFLFLSLPEISFSRQLLARYL
jgi:hypothetical protein